MLVKLIPGFPRSTWGLRSWKISNRETQKLPFWAQIRLILAKNNSFPLFHLQLFHPRITRATTGRLRWHIPKAQGFNELQCIFNSLTLVAQSKISFLKMYGNLVVRTLPIFTRPINGLANMMGYDKLVLCLVIIFPLRNIVCKRNLWSEYLLHSNDYSHFRWLWHQVLLCLWAARFWHCGLDRKWPLPVD